ncbi:hypothetical protein BV133_2918 [Blastochloris viridis]|uniref:Uncharacterized protein n=1 Tax=Blastochloris viridis TaxID=1079 RepID=A0A182D6H8_BLAVI|nr:hypothetical protein BV133_2918 [Blastochloris viridis]
MHKKAGGQQLLQVDRCRRASRRRPQDNFQRPTPIVRGPVIRGGREFASDRSPSARRPAGSSPPVSRHGPPDRTKSGLTTPNHTNFG